MEDRLKKLVTIVDYGSFTAAAAALHTSQPALSVSMQKLERELKQTLLQRSGTTLTLTPAGQVAYKRGKQLQLLTKNLHDELIALSLVKTHFTLGSIDSVAHILSSTDILEKLEEQVALSLSVHSSFDLLNQLKHDRCDSAIVVRQSNYDKHLEVTELGSEVFCLVTSSGYTTLPKSGALKHFLAYNQSSTTYQLVTQQLQQQGYTTVPSFYSTNPSVILQHALRGKGICAVPRSMAEHYISSGELVEHSLTVSITRPIDIVWQKDRSLHSALNEFTLELQKLLQI